MSNAARLDTLPIVGQRLYKLGCPNGHYEEVALPFQMVVPAAVGQPTAVVLCRQCWLAFISSNFGMRLLSEDEAAVAKAEAAGASAQLNIIGVA